MTKKTESSRKSSNSQSRKTPRKPTISKVRKLGVRKTTKAKKQNLKLNHSEEFIQHEEDEYQIVKECLSMHKTLADSLTHIHLQGFKMAKDKFYEYKNQIKEEKLKFFHQLALDSGLEESNADAIISFKIIMRKMWEEYDDALKPIERASILSRIAELNVYLADSIDVSKEIIREQAEIREEMNPETKKTITV